MSDESAFQSVGTVVTNVFLAGVCVVVGLRASAADTLVCVVVAELRWYHETTRLPSKSLERRAGKAGQPPKLRWDGTGGLGTSRYRPVTPVALNTHTSGWHFLPTPRPSDADGHLG